MLDHRSPVPRQSPPGGAGPVDWNARYVQGDTPWDRHSTVHELDRVLAEGWVGPGRALEMGCGTGRNALHLARAGFDVTAFDLAPRAIELAREHARRAALQVDFRVADFRHLPDLGTPFPFLFDSGFYHCVRKELLRDLLAFLERVTRPGSLWLTLAGNANDPQPPGKGPPRLRASELCAELEPLFAVVELRETRFEAGTADPADHPLAWSALLRRR
jgi:SAM-dependent methyltransferase